MTLKDRTALVTGGGSGLGRAIALRFAEEGARVIVNDLNLETARKTVEEMKPRGRAIQADVSDSAQVTAMFSEIEKEFGRLDILVNNAGIAEAAGEEMDRLNQKFEARVGETLSGEGVQTQWEVVSNMSDEAWLKMIGVHLNGTFFCTREAVKLMGGERGGVIVNMSSVAGLMGLEAAPHYSAAKAGIIGFTRAVAREVGSLNIRVNAICPSFIETPMTEGISPMLKMMSSGQTPLGRWGAPTEVASVVLFLASDESSFMTGQWISPNGGLFIG
jgi:3-oxoacyl-[acyl-carrier protein] reductase